MIDKIKEFMKKLNEKGIGVPMIRDPKSQMPSVSLTMMIISFNVVLVGLAGNASGYFGGINIEQAMYLLITTSSLYFGRTLTYGSKTVENKEEK